jgi:hypothetical protein
MAYNIFTALTLTDPKSPNVVMHARGSSYVQSTEEVEVQLTRWHANCILYDADPQGYSRTISDRALENVHRDQGRSRHDGSGSDRSAGMGSQRILAAASEWGKGWDLQEPLAQGLG